MPSAPTTSVVADIPQKKRKRADQVDEIDALFNLPRDKKVTKGTFKKNGLFDAPAKPLKSLEKMGSGMDEIFGAIKAAPNDTRKFKKQTNQ